MSRTSHTLDCGCRSCVNELLKDIDRLAAELDEEKGGLKVLSEILINTQAERKRLQAENVSLKEIADLALDIHTRDKLYVKEKWGVMGINAEKLLVRKIEDLTGE